MNALDSEREATSVGVGVSRPPAQAGEEVVVEGTRDLGAAIPGATGYRRRWWALAVLCLSLVVLAMDNTGGPSR